MGKKPEKRKRERVPLSLPAKLSVAGESKDTHTLHCSTSDICAGGAFFHTDLNMPGGTEMDVELVIPLDELKKLEGKNAKIKVSGSVTRTEEKGMAINFAGLKVLFVDK